ncbi:MAG TPA: hypothetical protein VFA07_04465 [Chthonomonadaceae bacterium]|nr:hypothetical protein [Chthonomonadaceae bacterium]
MKQEINPRVAVAAIAAALVLIGVWWYWHSTIHVAGGSHGAPQTSAAIGKGMAQSMREMGVEHMQRMAHRQNPTGASPPAPGGP